MSTRSARDPSDPRPPPPTRSAPLGSPLLVLNLKAYPGSLGAGALRTGRILSRLSERFHVSAAIAPSAPDVGLLAHSLSIPVLAQHADPFEAGARTGYLLPEAIANARACGSLVNHSERPLSFRLIAETCRRLQSIGLIPIVCAGDVPQARRLATLRPPYLAVEPPELIGGSRAVSTARPAVVSGTVRAVHAVSPRTHVLCGAGVHGREDVRRALELGAEGILVSSAVTRAANPAGALRELFLGFGERPTGRPTSPT